MFLSWWKKGKKRKEWRTCHRTPARLTPALTNPVQAPPGLGPSILSPCGVAKPPQARARGMQIKCLFGLIDCWVPQSRT
jgi:hypothetical protein